MKHSDYITHISNKEDEPYLRSKLLDVNMRLFHTSREYNHIVRVCCDYLKQLVLTKMDGYKKPHGMSGANAAIPFNIIAICRKRGTKEEYPEIMINPKIAGHSMKKEKALSNCGSIILKEPIEIDRWYEVRVKWYDIDGNPHEEVFGRKQGGFTIQHEIDHNLGVLITDYK